MPAAVTPLALEKGLPASIEAEQFVLGSILLSDPVFPQVAGMLEAEDFCLEKHRRIFARMLDLHTRSEKIDFVTLANELIKHNQLESCDGIAYISSLTEGLPRFENVDSYAKIVKDKSLLRRLIFTAQHIASISLEAADEADEILGKAEDMILKVGDARIRGGMQDPRQIVDGFPGGISEFLDPSKRLRGLSTGFSKLDELTTGLQPSELIIVAARPSVGKTALALNIAQHVVSGEHPRPVAVFSLEMSKESLLTRMLCAAARIDMHTFRGGFLNLEQRRRLSAALNKLVGAPLYLDDSAGANLMEIHAKCRRLKAEHGLALVVIDYLQLMSGRGKFENRNQEISALSRGLKQLAKELEVPIIALSQLSRAPEQRQGDHRPQLSDLRESGSIEQDADLVAFIFREEMYRPDNEKLHGRAELIIAKQRNGPTGKIELAFLNKFTKFENLAEDVSEPAAEFPPPDSVD